MRFTNALPFAVRPAASDATLALTAAALRDAAAWVGCTRVQLERVEPAAIAAPLRAALG